MNPIASIILALGLFLVLLATSVRTVPFTPPHIAVLTFLGRRTRKVLREGYHFCWLSPYVFDLILIETTRRNQELSEIVVRNSDGARLAAKISVSWAPSENHAIEFLNNGGEAGVRGVLEAMIKERLREWAANFDGQWLSAVKVREDATSILITDISGISSSVDSNQRTENIKKIRAGIGDQVIPSLGIVLCRLNIASLDATGALSNEAELSARKHSQIKSQALEFEHFRQMAKELMELGFTKEQSAEIIQTDRGQLSRVIKEYRGQPSAYMMSVIEHILGGRGGK